MRENKVQKILLIVSCCNCPTQFPLEVSLFESLYTRVGSYVSGLRSKSTVNCLVKVPNCESIFRLLFLLR